MSCAKHETDGHPPTRRSRARGLSRLHAAGRIIGRFAWARVEFAHTVNLCQSSAHILCVMLIGLMATAFRPSSCTAQAALDLPGAGNFKEMRILDGERLILLEKKLKSLEEKVKLEFVGASEKVESIMVEADRLDFMYDEKTEQLAQVVASGHVKLTMESSNRELRADTVVWSIAENKAECLGSPTLVSERGTLSAESITHYFNEDRTVVVKPRGTGTIPKKKESKDDKEKPTPKKEST